LKITGHITGVLAIHNQRLRVTRVRAHLCHISKVRAVGKLTQGYIETIDPAMSAFDARAAE
jgi:hypothetical protein